MVKDLPSPVLNRLPTYLHYVKYLYPKENSTISSGIIANALGLGEVQVRKDLALLSGEGKPKVGYITSELIEKLENALDVKTTINAVIVGAGHIGKALLYHDFDEYGVKVVASFDKAEKTARYGKIVLPMEDLAKFCAENDVQIGIITVPEEDAQEVCDKLISCGVRSIWNFAPTILKVSDGVNVKNENLAASLAVLAAMTKTWRKK